MSLLEAQELFVGYNGHEVLKSVELGVKRGQRWAVIGKNGTGKSTLVKTIAGLIDPSKGTVRVHDKPVGGYPARERARHIAYMPQKAETVIPYSVYDFVMLGRYSAMSLFGMPCDSDREAVVQAMAFCDVRDLGNRLMTTLSGGELQRVLLAGAIAQEAPLLLLDEPTTFLDPAHERFFFRALENAQKIKNLTIVMVTHDINTALYSCTHVLALLDGSVHYAGDVDAFKRQCPGILETLYGISFERFSADTDVKEVFGTWAR